MLGATSDSPAPCPSSSTRSAPRCTATHCCTASALNTLRTQLFPLASVVTPNLDEVRLLVGIDVVDAATQRDAARALHDLGPQWVLVKGGHLRSAPDSTDLLYDGDDLSHLRGAPGEHPP